jgi:hypothetical protein
MKKQYLVLAFLLLLQYAANSQMKIGDNPTTLNSASLLELESTNKGFVPPRVSLTNLSMPSPLPAGLITGTIVFNTNALVTNGNGIGLYYWNGSAWAPVNANTSITAWSLTGNAGTIYANNFLGTTDNVSFRIRTNNIQRILVDSLGSVAIGSEAFDPKNKERLLVDYGTTTSENVATFTGSINDVLEINVQNKNKGTNATSEYAALAADGTDTSNFVTMGINSLNYKTDPEKWGASHDAHLYANSRNLLLGTQTSNSDVIFLLGGGRLNFNSVFRLSGSTGNVIVGNGEASNRATGNILRGPNGAGGNYAGGSLTVQGGSGAGTGAAGSLNLYSGLSGSGAYSSVNIIANPLTITGVQPTSSFSTDSILTITNGVVKKAPLDSINTTGAFWRLKGNKNIDASVNFLGTTDANDLVVKTNNLERMRILGANEGASSKEGWVGLGTAFPRSPMDIAPSAGNSSVITIQNKDNGGYSSVDMYDATGTHLVNSFGYANPGANSFIADKDYFYFYNKDFLVTDGESNSNYNLFLQHSTGYIGINTSDPQQRFRVNGKFYLDSAFMPGGDAGTSGYVLISSGANLAPTWQPASSVTSNSWSLFGNPGTTSVNFLGTTDNQPLTIKVDNTQAGLLTINGQTALGLSSSATDQHATALGESAKANANASLALGYNAQATVQNAIALGSNALSNQSSSIAVGYSAQATAQTAMVYGNSSSASSISALVIGNGSTAAGPNSIILGHGSTTTSNAQNAIVIGHGITGVNQSDAIILGNPTSANAKVGIGTATPQDKLDVVGNIRFSGALMPNNIAGKTGQVLTSQGAGKPPIWDSAVGNFILNQSAITQTASFNISGSGIIGTNLSVGDTSIFKKTITSNGITNTGTFTTKGSTANINVGSNTATFINSGTSKGDVTIGNTNDNVILPGLLGISALATGDSVVTISSNGVVKKASPSAVIGGITLSKYSLSINFPGLGNNGQISVNVSVPNVVYSPGANAVITVNPDINDLPDNLIIGWARVSANNTVTIHFNNVANTVIPANTALKISLSVIQ